MTHFHRSHHQSPRKCKYCIYFPLDFFPIIIDMRYYSFYKWSSEKFIFHSFSCEKTYNNNNLGLNVLIWSIFFSRPNFMKWIQVNQTMRFHMKMHFNKRCHNQTQIFGSWMRKEKYWYDHQYDEMMHWFKPHNTHLVECALCTWYIFSHRFCHFTVGIPSVRFYSLICHVVSIPLISKGATVVPSLVILFSIPFRFACASWTCDFSE